MGSSAREQSVESTGRGQGIENVQLAERELWLDGPPYPVFKQMREGCPIHWTDGFEEFPHEAGFWSVTTAEDSHAVSRDWQTYSSELGGVTATTNVLPLELARAMFIGCSARATISSLFAVSRMSAGGAPGAASRTGSSPEPSTLTKVTPRSVAVTLIVRLPKYCSRSAGLISDSLPASFSSAVRHSSGVAMCASLLDPRYRFTREGSAPGGPCGYP